MDKAAIYPDWMNSDPQLQINRSSTEELPRLASGFTKRLRSSASLPSVSK